MTARPQWKPGRHGRLVALALLALLLLAAAWLGLVVRTDNAEAERRVQGLARLLAASQALVAREAALGAEVAALRRAGQLTDLFLPGDSEARAVAALQDLVKGATAKAGAGLDSIESLPVQPSDGLRLVSVRVRMTADVNGLQTALHILEAGRPLLVVEQLYVHARSVRPERGARNLDVRFDAVGYVPGGGS